MTPAAVVMTAESSLAARSRQEGEDLGPRTGRVGGPVLLWHAPGNTRDKSGERLSDRPRRSDGWSFLYRR